MTCLRRTGHLLGILLLLCASWAATDLRAQVVLADQSRRIDIWPQATVMTDAGGTLAIEQVLVMSGSFAAPRGAYATLGMEKQVVWLRVPVQVAAGGEGSWIFDLDYALLRSLDVYLVQDGKVTARAALGNGQPFASRPLQARSHAAPLEFSRGDAQLLLRIDSPGGKILPISLSRLPAFHARALGEQMLQGGLTALGVLLLVFSLAQWIHLRESLYLKYALLVFFSVTFSVHFFGIGEMYIWTDMHWPGYHLAGVTSLMAAAATALFVEDALAGDLHPKLRVALHAVAAAQVGAALAYAANLIDIQAVALFMSTTGLAPALMGLPGAVKKARRGDSVGSWFIAAWLGYFVSSAILVGVVRGRIDANFWTMHSFQLGATFDMLVFMRIAVLRSAHRHRTAQRAAQERDALFSMAHSDPLTGLLNRRGLADALSGALPRAREDRLLAIYMLDLDGFKPVNDRYGHDVGDGLLRVVAQRLRACVRSGDAVARLGGDEFVVMAEGLGSDAKARDLGMKLVEAFHSPFAITPHSCTVSATIGYAIAPPDADDPDALLKAADAAMYSGKQEGKDRLVRAGPALVTSPRQP